MGVMAARLRVDGCEGGVNYIDNVGVWTAGSSSQVVSFAFCILTSETLWTLRTEQTTTPSFCC